MAKGVVERSHYRDGVLRLEIAMSEVQAMKWSHEASGAHLAGGNKAPTVVLTAEPAKKDEDE